MEYTYTEIRCITPESLRQLCIQENWYTHGSNADYNHLLYDLACRDNLSTEDIAEISLDIIAHSSDLSDSNFEAVAFKIANIATVFIRRQPVEAPLESDVAVCMSCIEIFKKVHPQAEIETAKEMQIISGCMIRYLPKGISIHEIPRSELFAAERYARNQIIITLKALNKNKDWPW